MSQGTAITCAISARNFFAAHKSTLHVLRQKSELFLSACDHEMIHSSATTNEEEAAVPSGLQPSKLGPKSSPLPDADVVHNLDHLAYKDPSQETTISHPLEHFNDADIDEITSAFSFTSDINLARYLSTMFFQCMTLGE